MAYIVVGLGNPGGEYARTRHNAGRSAVEYFAQAQGFPEFALKKSAQASVSVGTLGKSKVELVLPEVFMNVSGKVVPHFVKSVPAAKKLVVIRDDLDMPLGTVKMTSFGRGAGGHHGVESVARVLKTKNFAQIKIGISGATAKGNIKKPTGEEKVISHVIGKFSPKEELILKEVYKKVAEATELFVTDGIEAAMLKANTK